MRGGHVARAAPTDRRPRSSNPQNWELGIVAQWHPGKPFSPYILALVHVIKSETSVGVGALQQQGTSIRLRQFRKAGKELWYWECGPVGDAKSPAFELDTLCV